MAKLDKYAQIAMTMQMIQQGRTQDVCLYCGQPKKHPSQITCLSSQCLRKWLPGNKESVHEKDEEDAHVEISTD